MDVHKVDSEIEQIMFLGAFTTILALFGSVQTIATAKEGAACNISCFWAHLLQLIDSIQTIATVNCEGGSKRSCFSEHLLPLFDSIQTIATAKEDATDHVSANIDYYDLTVSRHDFLNAKYAG